MGKGKLTNFGKLLKKLCIDKEVSIEELAWSLAVNPGFLSAVLNGHKKIPGDLPDKIIDCLKLNDSEKTELLNAIDQTRGYVRCKLFAENKEDHELILLFVNRFEGLTEEKKREIGRVLNE